MCYVWLLARVCFFFFKQKTAYEMRISDWSSDVCSSDLPSGSYAANAAWVACAAMAFNIARAVDALGAPGRARARWASVRTRLINVPARIAATGRRLVLHLPRDWPWAQDWQTAFTAATGPQIGRAHA